MLPVVYVGKCLFTPHKKRHSWLYPERLTYWLTDISTQKISPKNKSFMEIDLFAPKKEVLWNFSSFLYWSSLQQQMWKEDFQLNNFSHNNISLSFFSSFPLHKIMKFSIKDFVSKCDQIHKKLRILLHLLKKSLTENFIFCEVVSLLSSLNYKMLWFQNI